MPKLATPYASELQIQRACKSRVEGQFKARWVAIPNGTHIASRAGRGKVRAEGLSKGFCDGMILGHGPNAGRTAYAEIKANSSLSDEQKDWLTWLVDNGFDAGCFRNQDTLATFLAERGWQ